MVASTNNIWRFTQKIDRNQPYNHKDSKKLRELKNATRKRTRPNVFYSRYFNGKNTYPLCLNNICIYQKFCTSSFAIQVNSNVHFTFNISIVFFGLNFHFNCHLTICLIVKIFLKLTTTATTKKC